MKLESKLIAARPNDAAQNIVFVDTVMNQIGEQKRPRLSLLAKLHKNPGLVAILAAVGVVTLSGVAYAVSYLWPMTHISVTTPTVTKNDRQSVEVISSDCSPEIAGKKYELKKNATISTDKIPDVVKAECNLAAIRDWVSKTYPDDSKHIANISGARKPGETTEGVRKNNVLQPRKIKSLTDNTITLAALDQWNAEATLALTPDVNYIVNHQYKKRADLKPGDSIVYVTQTTMTLRDENDCNDTHCSTRVENSQEKLLAVITLDQPLEDYYLFGSLSELVPCTGNPKDQCHTGNIGAVELYMNESAWNQMADTTVERCQIEGKLISYDTAGMVIKTTSGRKVTLSTTHDIVSHFNATRSGDYNNLKVTPGDVISIDYARAKDDKNMNNINITATPRVSVLLELISKGDPINKF